MDRSEFKTNIHTDNARGSVSVHRNLLWTWFKQPYNYPENNRGYKRNRHHKYLLAVIATLVAAPVNAETVGA